MKKIDILGVGISKITLKEAVETVDKWLTPGVDGQNPWGHFHFRYVVTPNPEMLVLAQKDKEFKEILNQADMAIPDGIGLVWASKLVGRIGSGKDTSGVTRRGSSEVEGTGASERVSGIDLMLSLCALACQKGYTIGLLGGGEGVAQKTKRVLEKKFPGRSKLVPDGIKIVFSVSNLSNLRNLSNLSNLSVDLLFVALGAPKQEKFIYSLIQPQGSAAGATRPLGLRFHLAMGVGGSFDFISGKIPRAPQILQNLGLEWLWRLLIEPKRLKRIWNAVVVFPYLILKSLK